jgi:hypothetical protein
MPASDNGAREDGIDDYDPNGLTVNENGEIEEGEEEEDVDNASDHTGNRSGNNAENDEGDNGAAPAASGNGASGNAASRNATSGNAASRNGASGYDASGYGVSSNGAAEPYAGNDDSNSRRSSHTGYSDEEETEEEDYHQYLTRTVATEPIQRQITPSPAERTIPAHIQAIIDCVEHTESLGFADESAPEASRDDANIAYDSSESVRSARRSGDTQLGPTRPEARSPCASLVESFSRSSTITALGNLFRRRTPTLDDKRNVSSISIFEQAILYSRLEFVLTTATNNFLMLNKGLLKVEAVRKVVETWESGSWALWEGNKIRHPRVVEFMFPLNLQVVLVEAHAETFVEKGRFENQGCPVSQRRANEIIGGWKHMVSSLPSRTLQMPDCFVVQHIKTVNAVLVMLGKKSEEQVSCTLWHQAEQRIMDFFHKKQKQKQHEHEYEYEQEDEHEQDDKHKQEDINSGHWGYSRTRSSSGAGSYYSQSIDDEYMEELHTDGVYPDADLGLIDDGEKLAL